MERILAAIDMSETADFVLERSVDRTHRSFLRREALDVQRDAGPVAALVLDRLQERLRSGPVKADDLVEEAKQEGISFATLRRAKKELGIKSRKGGFDGEWIWELPPRI